MWLKIVLILGFTLAAIVLFIPLNTVPVILVMMDWINESVIVFDVTYLFNVEKNNIIPTIPPIMLRDVHSLNDIHVIDNMSELETFVKLFVAVLFVIHYVHNSTCVHIPMWWSAA